MIIKRASQTLSFFRTTAIGGVLLLLPLVVLLGLLAYVYHFAVVVHEQLRPWIPLDSAIGFALIYILAVAGLFAACFFAGLMARRAIAVRFAGTIEKQLMKVFPRYGIYKDLLAGRIVGGENAPSLTPIVALRDGARYVAFETDRVAGGFVVVYFPGAPDTWNGSVGLLPAENVERLALSFDDALSICERLGRNSAAELVAALPSPAKRDDL